MAFAGDGRIRCRKCEGYLNRALVVTPESYGLIKNKHGAVARTCADCKQLWLVYVQELPNHSMKIIAKMIDKLA